MLRDSRWDFTYLGMQILVEGLALAAFGLIRDLAKDPLAAAINAYVMQDEARHVAFGRMALRDYYPQLTEDERDQREEFCGRGLLPDARPVPRRGGVAQPRANGDEAVDHVRNSLSMKDVPERCLFTRIVPALRDIGLWGARVQRAFADMGVMELRRRRSRRGHGQRRAQGQGD